MNDDTGEIVDMRVWSWKIQTLTIAVGVRLSLTALLYLCYLY
jgi:hypothetical protein